MPRLQHLNFTLKWAVGIMIVVLLVAFTLLTDTGRQIASTFLGYVKSSESSEVDTFPHEERAEKPKVVITEEQALQEVQFFLDLVKNRDEAGLLKYYQERNFYDYYASFLSLEQMAKDTIEGFESIYDIETMQISHFGRDHYPENHQFHVIIVGSKQGEKPVEQDFMVGYSDGSSGYEGFKIQNHMITYFTQTKRFMKSYVHSIQEKDPGYLAMLLTPDDVSYPIYLATNAIKEYEVWLDISHLNYEYNGFSTDEGHQFYYLIYDQQKLKKHQVKIYFADGLLCMEDPFVPEFEMGAPDEVIRQFAQAIGDRDAERLVEMYGGDYEWLTMFSPESERRNKEKVFENYLKVLGEEKLFFNTFVSGEKISEDEYVYVITFRYEDGQLFSVNTVESSQTEFSYTVKKIDGEFKVMEPPPYQP